MKVAHDIFAETNPAFCAHVIAAFSKGYHSISEARVDLALCYVALPITLSGELTSTFGGSNRNTGLLEWLRRHPVIQIGLSERIDGSLDIVTAAVRFGCFSKILTMDMSGRIAPGVQRLKRPADLSDEIRNVFKHSERLGIWMAMAGSTRTTLDMMGVTV